MHKYFREERQGFELVVGNFQGSDVSRGVIDDCNSWRVTTLVWRVCYNMDGNGVYDSTLAVTIVLRSKEVIIRIISITRQEVQTTRMPPYRA
jgi:hypothetical protein